MNFVLLNVKIIYSKPQTTVCKTEEKQKTLLSIFLITHWYYITLYILSLKSLSVSLKKWVTRVVEVVYGIAIVNH